MTALRTPPVRRAFTLLELLVALGCAAVLLSALLVAFSGSWRLQEQAQRRALAEAPRAAAVQRLRRELAAAVPPGGLLAEPLLATMTTSGEQRQDDLTFVAAIGATSPDTAGGDLVRLHYYLPASETTADAWQLVRTAETNLLAVATDSEPAALVVLDDVAAFTVSGYDGSVWQDGWDATVQGNVLPAALRVRVDFAERAGVTPRPLQLTVPFAAVGGAIAAAAPSTGGGAR